MESVLSQLAVIIALVAAGFTAVQARAARRQAESAKEQVEVSMEQVKVAANSAEKAANQAEAYAGAQSAIAWRNQVLDLHDRGLSPGQIRYIMHLEDGGAGYEGWNGRIDDVVSGLRPAPLSDAGSAASAAHVMSCDQMPRDRDSCTGPCQKTCTDSGCEAYRLADSGSPNESAGQLKHD